MSNGKNKLDFRSRPKWSPREKAGSAIIIMLFLATYVFVLNILGGAIKGDWLLVLDPTGHLQVAGQKWANASIPYRERMVPVFITMFYYYFIVMAVTFVSRSWSNMKEWAPRYEWWRLIAAVITVMVCSLFTFVEIGSLSPVERSRELSRFFERPVFANKYSFILMVLVVTVFAYWTAEILSVFGSKLKLLISPSRVRSMQ